jgi:hypothetical protein
MLKDMKAQGVIKESDNLSSSPLLLVGKKAGEIRFCMDYRQLNGVTMEDFLTTKSRRHPEEARWDEVILDPGFELLLFAHCFASQGQEEGNISTG